MHISVPARYFASLCDFLDKLDVDSTALLHEAGIDPTSFHLPQATITPAQSDGLLAAAVRATGRTDLAFEVCRNVLINAHDILGYAALNCATPDEMLRMVARYYSVITPMFSLSYRRQDGEVELLFRPVQSMPAATMCAYQEGIVSSTFHSLRAILGQAPQRCRIHMSIQEPPHAARYRELAPATVYFGASALPMVKIVMDAEQLDAPHEMGNPRARELAEQRCAALLQRMRSQESWKEWIGMMLAHAEECQPTLTELATLLNIAPRTLDRYLRKEQTTFRAITLEVRNQRARRMLEDSAQPISEIAVRLGYTTLASFSRAFAAANGCSPRAWRERAAGARSLDCARQR